MLSPMLESQILYVVKKFFVVRRRQLTKFFSDWGGRTVENEISMLIGKGLLVAHDEEYISYSRKLPKPLSYYEPCMTALDVVSVLHSDKIVWLNKEDFPVELTFSTTDNVIYDVVVFDEQWIPKYSMIPRTRGKCLPPGESDPVQHIAVVPNIELANKVDELGFSLYAMVDRHTGKTELFSLT